MKKYLFLIFIFITCSLSANEMKIFEGGKIQFEVPESDNITFVGDKRNPFKIRITVNTVDNEGIKRRNPVSISNLLYKQLCSDSFKIDKEHIVKMIENNDISKTNTFSIAANWYNDYGNIIFRNYLPVSYKKLIYDGEAIGESFMSIADINTGHELVNKYFSVDYRINFVMQDKLVYILINLTWGDFESLYKTFPEWFELRADNEYYWINQQSQYDFFKVFDSNEYIKLPDTIKLLRETRDSILKSLIIND